MYVQKFWIDFKHLFLFFVNFIKISILCSPILHLFDQKYVKQHIFWNIITI